MKAPKDRAGSAGDVQVLNDGGKHWTLVFVRELRHPPERVWTALTDPVELRQWAPFEADHDLGRPGPATLMMLGGREPEPSKAVVVRAEFPRLLEYTWEEDLVRWELVATAGGGTRLTLRHGLTDRSLLAKVASGWHLCLDVAERLMSGEAVESVAGEQAKAHGWERLRDEYAAKLGLPPGD